MKKSLTTLTLVFSLFVGGVALAAPKAPRIAPKSSVRTPSSAKSSSNPYAGTRFYSKSGQMTSRITNGGGIVKTNGVYSGRVDSKGRVYDNIGRYQGQVKSPKK